MLGGLSIAEQRRQAHEQLAGEAEPDAVGGNQRRYQQVGLLVAGCPMGVGQHLGLLV